MKKIALITPNNLWVSPYVSIYIRLFEQWGIPYETISWNREGVNETGIQYNKKEKSRNMLKVLISYYSFVGFVKKTIKRNNYDRLVIFTPQLGVFMESFLRKKYKNRYVFDYRDLSIEQNVFFKTPFKRLLSNSFVNVISSPGFKKYLPPFDFVVSHNFNTEVVNNAIGRSVEPNKGDSIKVLTIGAIREDMNVEVIDALGDVDGFDLSFVGKGISAEYLEEYVNTKGYRNITFAGYYPKEEEPSIIKSHTLINIVYPLIPSHISALSNRFYNSLIYKRPMIVTKGTIQGDYARQYDVGLVIDDCKNLDKKIVSYLGNLDYNVYSKQCDFLLDVFLEENREFEKTIKAFVTTQ